MTKALFNYKNNEFISFEIKDHAEYSDFGTDIVCAAITTATFTTLGLLQKILNNNYLYSEKEACIKFEIIDINSNNDLVKQVIENFIEVLENIEKQYPKHLKIKIAKN